VVFVVALLLAPALANIWPAFGKGAMLFVGETVAAHDEHAAHEGHQAPAPQSHHQQHCALCVLAFLAWAPPAVPALGCTEACVTDRGAQVAESTPRLLLVWRSAQARAPPLS